jgi:hypothetical protein
MKVEIEKTEDPTVRQYPWVGVYLDIIVAFTAPEEGICLSSDNFLKYRKNWSEEDYKVFTGKITITL